MPVGTQVVIEEYMHALLLSISAVADLVKVVTGAATRYWLYDKLPSDYGGGPCIVQICDFGVSPTNVPTTEALFWYRVYNQNQHTARTMAYTVMHQLHGLGPVDVSISTVDARLLQSRCTNGPTKFTEPDLGWTFYLLSMQTIWSRIAVA